MKIIFLLIIFSYSLSLIVFPFKVRENDAKEYLSPINQTKIDIKDYLNHILNSYEFISEIEMGTPRQKVELIFNFDDNYLTLLSHFTSSNSYFYNLSSSYQELIVKDKDLSLIVPNSVTIKEVLHMKNKFYNNLNDFINSRDEISHEFIIIFSKNLPQKIKNRMYYSNSVYIGLLVNTRYKGEHGIYKPFLNEVKEKGFIDNFTFFLYFFKEYKESILFENENDDYEGIFVIGKYPHQILPNKYDIKNLYWTDTFLKYSEYIDYENIIWGIKFNEVYIEQENNKKQNFEYLQGIFDLNVEYIFPPHKYYEAIKNFFQPLNDICFTEPIKALLNSDSNVYNMVYCDYKQFGEKYLKTFPKLVFKIDDFNDEFEFTYKDLFKPIYDNKYYLFLIFTELFKKPLNNVYQPASYPWTLGRIFFKKYQFVFDSLNKKVGYYKNNTKTIKEDTTDNIDEIITDDTIQKESDSDINNQSDDEIKNTENIDKDKNEINTDKKDSGNILFIISMIVLFIIIVFIAIFCYQCFFNKKKRKKKANELIDENENEYLSNGEDEKGIN